MTEAVDRVSENQRAGQIGAPLMEELLGPSFDACAQSVLKAQPRLRSMNPREDELPFLTYVNAVAPAVLTIATIRISVSRSPMLHHSSFRSLARLCQVQASLATDDRTRRVLEQMATEYTRKADHEEAADGAGDNPQRVVVKKLR